MTIRLRGAPSRRILEIGAGEEAVKTPDRAHVDMRALPGIDFIQDGSNLSNIPDGSFGKVISRYCLEHISWRQTVPTLSEWARVLIRGGKIEAEVPSARHPAKIVNMQDPKTDAMRDPSESDFEHFNRITFGHQDYEENFHKSLFTEDWLAELLDLVGFGEIKAKGIAGSPRKTPWGWSASERFLMIGKKQ